MKKKKNQTNLRTTSVRKVRTHIKVILVQLLTFLINGIFKIIKFMWSPTLCAYYFIMHINYERFLFSQYYCALQFYLEIHLKKKIFIDSFILSVAFPGIPFLLSSENKSSFSPPSLGWGGKDQK